MTQPPSPEIRRSLRLSITEGIPAALMLGIVEFYAIPLALFLGATTQQIGLLTSLPYLLGALSLLWAVNAVGLVGSRLRFVVRGALWQATLLAPIAFLAVYPAPGRLAWLIVLMVAFRVLFNLIGAAWGSVMSDYLPPEQRGRYFGRRARAIGIAQVAGMGLAGVILSLTTPNPALGFMLIFLIAAGARAFSAYYLAQMADLPLHPTPGGDFTFLAFLRRFKESNFVRFVLYVASIMFATFLSAPYFNVYMLRDLQLPYMTYMAIHLAAVIMGLVSFPIWGRHADVVGNARVLKTTSLLVPIIPFLWLCSRHPLYLVGVELFAGFVWGGFTLCVTNFIFDAVTPAKRVRCLGYFNLINGVALFAGTLLGGYLADRLPPLLGYRLLTLFVLSGTLRLLAHGFLSGRFTEVRATHRPVSSLQLFFSAVGIRPLLAQDQEQFFTIWPIWRFRRRRPAAG